MGIIIADEFDELCSILNRLLATKIGQLLHTRNILFSVIVVISSSGKCPNDTAIVRKNRQVSRPEQEIWQKLPF